MGTAAVSTNRGLMARAIPCGAALAMLLMASACSREPDLATMLSTGEPVGSRAPAQAPPAPSAGCPNDAVHAAQPRPANT